jgi:FKBP-type peptidyl-prolyl cis-trans isomerase FkpA
MLSSNQFCKNFKINYMRKSLVLSALVFSMVFSGCMKDSGPTTCPYQINNVPVPDAEVTAVQNFVALNSAYSGAVKDNAGFYYIIGSLGTGETPNSLCNNVSVLYKGMLTNGSIFDQTTTTPAVFALGQLIEGWRRGLPLIKEGGKITLILPPTLGYGNNEIKDPQSGVVKIPANSILIFELELKDVL